MRERGEGEGEGEGRGREEGDQRVKEVIMFTVVVCVTCKWFVSSSSQ